jgi:hypothetical protein
MPATEGWLIIGIVFVISFQITVAIILGRIRDVDVN